jgi:predicted dehydrogenase
MKFALIGTGSFGLKRASAVKNSKNGELIKVFDTNSDNLDKAANLLEVSKANNLEEIFKDKNIETICICTPNKFHKDLILEALDNGKNIFCEKPLATSLEEANVIFEHSKNLNNKVQIGSNHRFFESVKFAKKLVDNNEIGKILSFNGRIGHNGERIQNSWFWKKELSGGGTLIDNGCHLLDLARFFMGNFISGSGSTSNIYWKKEIEVEDTATGNFKTEDGRMATIFTSWRLLSGYFFIELNGSDGYINIDGRFDTHGGDKVFWKGKDKKINFKDFSSIKPNSYGEEIDNFINNIEAGKDCSPSIKDGLEVMRMVNFIYSK